MELELPGLPTSHCTRQRPDPSPRAGRATGIPLQMSVDEQLGEVRADEREVPATVVLNLLSNAIRVHAGGRTDRSRSQLLRDGSIEVSVTDTGIGIAPGGSGGGVRGVPPGGDRERRRRKGQGCGLTSAGSSSELHRRADRGHERGGRGSTFTFTIPVRHGKVNWNRQLSPIRAMHACHLWPVSKS